MSTQAPAPLAPCPYCGGKTRMRRKSGTRGRVCHSQFYREHVSCEDCGAQGPVGKSPNSTIARWNRVAAAVASEASR